MIGSGVVTGGIVKLGGGITTAGGIVITSSSFEHDDKITDNTIIDKNVFIVFIVYIYNTKLVSK